MKKTLFSILLIGVMSLAILTSCQSSALQTFNKDFPRSEYLTFMGSGYSLIIAEQNARENLAAYFGFNTTISGNLNNKVDGSDAYYDSLYNNDEVVTNRVGIRGVTIEKAWEEKGIYYALAVMNKAESITTYRDLLANKVDFINEFYSVLNSREAYDLNDLTLTSVLYNETVSYFNNLNILNKLSPDLAKHFETAIHPISDVVALIQRVKDSIPFSFVIEGRGRGRTELTDALNNFFTSRNFHLAEEGTRYSVEVEYELVPIVMKDSNRFFYKYSISLKIIDNNDSTSVMNIEANAREGHETADLARDRCIEKMVAVINGDLATSFDSQFGSL